MATTPESMTIEDWCQEKRWRDKEWKLTEDWLSPVPLCKSVVSTAVAYIGLDFLHLVDDQVIKQQLLSETLTKDLIMIVLTSLQRTIVTFCKVCCYSVTLSSSPFFSPSFCFLDSLSQVNNFYKRVILPKDYQCKLSCSAAPQMCLCFAKPFYNCIFLFMKFLTITEQ